MFLESINIVKISLIIFFLVIFISLFLIKKKEVVYLSVGQLILIFSFFGIFTHSLIFSTDLSSSFLIIVGIIWLILVYLIQDFYGKDLALKKISASIYWFGNLFVLINAFAILIFGFESLSIESNFRGITQNANYLATILSVLIYPCLFSNTFSESNKNKKLNAIILLLCLGLIVLTRSRTAFFTVLIVSIFYIFIRADLKKVSMYQIIKLSFLGLAIIIYLGLSIEEIINKYEGQGLLSTRQNLINLRLEAISQKPLVGWGFAVNQFTEFDQFHKYNAGEKGNTILALIEELGLIYGSIYLILFFFALYKAIKNLLISKVNHSLSLVLVASTVSIQGETWLFNFYSFTALLVWAILFISLSGTKKQKKYENITFHSW